MNNQITELLYVARDPAWAPWAVTYFFLIGLSYAAIALSLPGVAFASPRWREASRMALLGAVITGVAAPVALLSDLGNPGRFLNFYLHPQATSWMSWGAFFLPVYVAALLLYAWAALAPNLREASEKGGLFAPLRRLLGAPERPALVRLLGIVAALAAVPVALYTGVEVMVAKARPLWGTSLLPFQFVATAFVGSAGMALILERLVGAADPASERKLARVLVASLVATIVVGALWFAIALLAPSSVEGRALAQVETSPVWRVNALWLAAAVLVPLVLARVRPVGLGWVAGLLALNAAWMFRWTIFMGGQNIPKTGAGWYSHPLELGPEGLLGIVGTAGLVLLIAIVLTTLVDWSRFAAEPAPAPRASRIGG
jgi:tetrathionate reductase subunit C